MAAPKDNTEKVHDMATSGWQQSDIASKYKLAENATRPYAAFMMKKASLATHVGDINAFDLACGTGSVEVELYNALPKEKWGDGSVKVFGGDVSDSMLGYLKERGEKEGWTGLSTGIVDGNVSSTFFFLLNHSPSGLPIYSPKNAPKQESYIHRNRINTDEKPEHQTLAEHLHTRLRKLRHLRLSLRYHQKAAGPLETRRFPCHLFLVVPALAFISPHCYLAP